MGGEMKDWRELIAQAEDLDIVKAALVREGAIRHIMALSGESRQIVAEVADANESMDHEAMLELTDGEPTTLKDALRRYVDELDKTPPDSVDAASDWVTADEIRTLLDYPWPGER